MARETTSCPTAVYRPHRNRRRTCCVRRRRRKSAPRRLGKSFRRPHSYATRHAPEGGPDAAIDDFGLLRAAAGRDDVALFVGRDAADVNEVAGAEGLEYAVFGIRLGLLRNHGGGCPEPRRIHAECLQCHGRSGLRQSTWKWPRDGKGRFMPQRSLTPNLRLPARAWSSRFQGHSTLRTQLVQKRQPSSCGAALGLGLQAGRERQWQR